jgi:hypothetical protein
VHLKALPLHHKHPVRISPSSTSLPSRQRRHLPPHDLPQPFILVVRHHNRALLVHHHVRGLTPWPNELAVCKASLPVASERAHGTAGVTTLIAWLSVSATTISSLAASATSQGQLKRAASPCRSAKPSSPLPASVLTSLALNTRRRAWFPLSTVMAV